MSLFAKTPEADVILKTRSRWMALTIRVTEDSANIGGADLVFADIPDSLKATPPGTKFYNPRSEHLRLLLEKYRYDIEGCCICCTATREVGCYECCELAAAIL